MVSFISVAGTTSLKVLSLMKCYSFAPPASPIESLLNVHCSEHCQYCFRPRKDSMPYGVDHEWTMPALQGVTGQFFREVSLILSQRDLSFLFSQRSKGWTSGTLMDFSTSEPHLRRFSPLYVFYYHPFLLGVFILLVFLWTSYITLNLPFEYVLSSPWKASLLSIHQLQNSKLFFILQVTIFLDEDFPNAPRSFRCSFPLTSLKHMSGYNCWFSIYSRI